MKANTSIVAKICAMLVKFYQVAISPIIHIIPGSGCRFEPTCSEYTRQAIIKYGAFRGIAMGFCRILRCNPFCRGGLDPIPEKFSWKKIFSINAQNSKKS